MHELIQVFECPCYHKTFKNRRTYLAHFHSKRHKTHEMNNDVRASSIEHKRLENENNYLRNRVKQLEEQVDKLIRFLGKPEPLTEDLLNIF